MKNNYTENSLDDHEQHLFFEHVIQEDFDLLHIDLLLQQAFADQGSQE